MNEKMKKFGKNSLDKWNALANGLKIGIIASVFLVLTAIIIVAAVNKSGDKKDYVVLFKGMSNSETAEVVRLLNANGTDIKMNQNGELMVRGDKWDAVTLTLAEKGYPRTAPTYGSFLDSLTMTQTDWEKKQALIIALEQKLETTLRVMDGVNDASVTLSIAQESELVWEDNQEKSSASVTITRDPLFTFTPANVSAVKNLVSHATQKMEASDVVVVDSLTGKILNSQEEIYTADEDNGNSNKGDKYINSMTLDEQASQQKREIAIENAAAATAQVKAIDIIANIFGEGCKVEARATYDLNYDNVLQELTEYLPEDNGMGVPTDEHVKYIVDHDLHVNDGGIVGEDENTDIPTYQNELEGKLTNSDGTYYERDTFWAISQMITQTERAKGAVESASISVSVSDPKIAILNDDEILMYKESIANATNIPVEKVSFVHRYVPEHGSGSVPAGNEIKVRFKQLMWRIMPWLVGLGCLVIILIVLLIAYGQRKTKREVRRAELESQAAIQSLQTTLDEHKRTLQDEVEAHQSQTNSTANEVREFVKDNPEITAALIRSMLHHD